MSLCLFRGEMCLVVLCGGYREKMESQLEKEARFCQLMAHSSHDSAIDTDSLEWETEVVEFEKGRVSPCACLFGDRELCVFSLQKTLLA